MKYCILLFLIVTVGCGMLKSKPEQEVKEDPIRPPAPHEIIKNPDGTYTVIIDESLNVKSDKQGVSFTKWLCSLSFLAITCIGAWALVKRVYGKELGKGYDV